MEISESTFADDLTIYAKKYIYLISQEWNNEEINKSISVFSLENEISESSKSSYKEVQNKKQTNKSKIKRTIILESTLRNNNQGDEWFTQLAARLLILILL